MTTIRCGLTRALALLGVLCVVATADAAEPGVTPQQVVIGQSITLQGGKNAYGVAVLSGMKLLFDQVNQAGGVAGRRIALRTVDDDNDAKIAAANARALVRDNVFLLFGPIEGGPSTAVAQVASELQVPLFGPVAGSPALRRPHQPMVFPVRAEHRDEFRALMEWGRRTGLKTVGFLHADSEVGRQHLANVRLLATELGMQVVEALPFKGDPSDTDIASMARLLAAARPDMVFNHGSVGTYARLIQRARADGVRSNFMAVNSGSSQLARTLGDAAKGMVFAQVVPSPWEGKHAISREYREALQRSGSAAEPSYGALEGYMTAKALTVLMRSVGRDLTRANLVRAAEATSTDLGGVKVRWSPGDHAGSQFVDLAIVARDGRFVH